MNLPSYAQLPTKEGLPPKSAWGVWGDEDEIGSINLLTPERALRAAELVKRGAVFSLNWELEEPSPALYGRDSLKHNVSVAFPNILDDSIDNLFTQASSQLDALCHVGHPRYGYWNGASEAEVSGSNAKNGIEHWARKGIVGRGVLLDIERHWRQSGRALDCGSTIEFTASDLEEVRATQGVEFEEGDILILRTGWINWYRSLSSDAKADLSNDSINRLTTPGLASGDEMAAWLWDHHFAVVAADNPAVEAWPHALEEESYLHFKLIPMLGFALGEMWMLEELAADCARDGKYEFMVTSAPLNLRGGVGSPPNAIAIK